MTTQSVDFFLSIQTLDLKYKLKYFPQKRFCRGPKTPYQRSNRDIETLRKRQRSLEEQQNLCKRSERGHEKAAKAIRGAAKAIRGAAKFL